MKLNAIIPDVPNIIAQALEDEYRELESRFAKRDWGPAELNGGRFAEALLRYLEWKGSRSFTPIGTELKRSSLVSAVKNNSAIPEGLRFHALGCAELLLDIRNKRDVGHLGANIDVNEMDSRLVKRLASWALAEIVRVESQVSPDEGQAIVDRLSARSLSLVEEVGGDLIVVATDLKTEQRTLVGLYQSFPHPWNIAALREAVSYKNRSRFRDILADHVSSGLVHLKGNNVYLTRKGAAWVDKNIDLELKI